jgi:hypothetical protein
MSVTARPETWVCGRSLDGIVGSNPAGCVFVSCECSGLSCRGLYVGPITGPESISNKSRSVKKYIK